MKIYETVKIVNNYEIYRMIGTHGFYNVKISKNQEISFRTIKAAAAWCEAQR